MKAWTPILSALLLALPPCLPTAVAQSGGAASLSMHSADGRYALTIGGLAQVDGRFFADGADDELLVRRARLTFDVKAGERSSLRIRPESSNGEDVRILDAYVDTRLSQTLSLRVGKFKPPLGLERLQSARDLRLVERSFVSELIASRDVGLQLSGERAALDWAFGLFNGAPDGRAQDRADDGDPEAAARLFFQPSDPDGTGNAVFGAGIGMSFGTRKGDAGDPLLAAYRSPGQAPIFSYRGGDDGSFAAGNRLRLSPQFYWFRGSFGLTGEWARVRQELARRSVDRTATLDHDAWQLTAEWFVTGEASGFSDPAGAGAMQLVARLSGLDFDNAAFAGGDGSLADPLTSVTKAKSAAIGANWFPLAGLKASLVYQHTAFDGGAAAGDREAENLFLLRLQQEF